MAIDFDMADHESDWKQYQKLVLFELKRLGANVEKIAEAQATHRIEIENIKAKAGFLGVISGVFTSFSLILGKHFYDIFNK